MSTENAQIALIALALVPLLIPVAWSLAGLVADLLVSLIRGMR